MKEQVLFYFLLEYTWAKITSVPRKLRWSLLLKHEQSVCLFFSFRLFVLFCFSSPLPPRKSEKQILDRWRWGSTLLRIAFLLLHLPLWLPHLDFHLSSFSTSSSPIHWPVFEGAGIPSLNTHSHLCDRGTCFFGSFSQVQKCLLLWYRVPEVRLAST